MDHQKFIEELFSEKPDNAWINIWQTPLKRSKFFDKIQNAIDFVASIKEKRNSNIFINCGLIRDNLGSRKRGLKEDIIGLPGLYADIDFARTSNPNYPPDLKAALNLVKGKGYDPTIIVHSGNGIHAWWLFKELWMFENKKDGDNAEMLNRRLNATIQADAAEKGWVIDSVFDRTRVLRIPGTFNCKNLQKIIRAKILELNDIRYGDIDSFDEFLIPEYQIKISPKSDIEVRKKISENITLNKNANPPEDLLKQLIEIDPKIEASWENRRKDMKKKSSPSEHALSLASFAAEAGWEDQEIADLIVAFYRRHNFNMRKAMRPDFISNTIDLARKTYIDRETEKIVKKTEKKTGEIEETEAEEARKRANRMLGLDIQKIVQHEGEKKSKYVVYTKKNPDGVTFYNSNDFTTWAKFKQRIIEKCRVRIRVKAGLWDIVLDHFMKFIEVKETDLLTPQKRFQEWLHVYLENKQQITLDQSASDNEPFVKDDHWYIYDQKFRNWAFQNKSYLEGYDDMTIEFSIIDAKKERFEAKHPTVPKRTKTCRPYKIPHRIIKPAPEPKLVVDNTEKEEIESHDTVRKNNEGDKKLQHN